MNNTEDCIVTKHAINRFLERTPDPNPPQKPNTIKKAIKKLFQNSFEIRFSKEHQFRRLLNNGCEDAKYFYNQGWIFVCSNNTIVTMERQGLKQFGVDLFKTEETIAKEKARKQEIQRKQDEERLNYLKAREKVFGKEDYD
jgi:hypothetical protein